MKVNLIERAVIPIFVGVIYGLLSFFLEAIPQKTILNSFVVSLVVSVLLWVAIELASLLVDVKSMSEKLVGNEKKLYLIGGWVGCDILLLLFFFSPMLTSIICLLHKP